MRPNMARATTFFVKPRQFLLKAQSHFMFKLMYFIFQNKSNFVDVYYTAV